jgi:hypothetical protein
VRVNADGDGDADAGPLTRERQRRRVRIDRPGRSHADDRRDAGGRGARQHRVAVGVELGLGDVTV